ncbi:MAG: TfoX/Sxy family protein [Blastocatellales bacterium]
MAYDEKLADRIRHILIDTDGISEKKMFGGLAFLLNGHMCVGIVGDKLMVRTGPDAYQAALGRPHVSPMDFTGRPMKGMIYVSPEGIDNRRKLAAWIGAGLDFASSLPPK